MQNTNVCLARSLCKPLADFSWLQLRDDIQTASATNSIRGMYEGPTQTKTVPLKSSSWEVITDR